MRITVSRTRHTGSDTWATGANMEIALYTKLGLKLPNSRVTTGLGLTFSLRARHLSHAREGFPRNTIIDTWFHRYREDFRRRLYEDVPPGSVLGVGGGSKLAD